MSLNPVAFRWAGVPFRLSVNDSPAGLCGGFLASVFGQCARLGQASRKGADPAAATKREDGTLQAPATSYGRGRRILWNSKAGFVMDAKTVLRWCPAMLGGVSRVVEGFQCVLWDASAIAVHHAQVPLCPYFSPVCGVLKVPSR
jgi:hypothetical protein